MRLKVQILRNIKNILLSGRLIRKMSTKEYILENDTPIISLNCKEAFENLTDKEKKYLHNYSQVNNFLTLIIAYKIMILINRQVTMAL